MAVGTLAEGGTIQLPREMTLWRFIVAVSGRPVEFYFRSQAISSRCFVVDSHSSVIQNALLLQT